MILLTKYCVGSLRDYCMTCHLVNECMMLIVHTYTLKSHYSTGSETVQRGGVIWFISVQQPVPFSVPGSQPASLHAFSSPLCDLQATGVGEGRCGRWVQHWLLTCTNPRQVSSHNGGGQPQQHLNFPDHFSYTYNLLHTPHQKTFLCYISMHYHL